MPQHRDKLSLELEDNYRTYFLSICIQLNHCNRFNLNTQVEQFYQVIWNLYSLKRKAHILSWRNTPNLFAFKCSKSYKKIFVKKFYAESHIEFLIQCDHSLWKSSYFFISLPFKKNKDANLRKASHIDMNLDNLKLVVIELEELTIQEIIKDTISP